MTISFDPEAVTRDARRLAEAAADLGVAVPAAPDAGRSSDEVSDLLGVLRDQLTAAAGSLASLGEAALEAVEAFRAQEEQAQQDFQPTAAPSPTERPR